MTDQERVLKIALRLLKGQKLRKQTLMDEYATSPSTIQRDINAMRQVFGEQFCRNKGLYWLDQQLLADQAVPLTDDERAAVAMILINSRGLSRAEITPILNKLMVSENSAYQALLRLTPEWQGVPKTALFKKMAFIAQAIREHHALQFDYQRNGEKHVALKRFPTGLFFGDLYFYMATGDTDAEDDLMHEKLMKFRLDNMNHLKIIGERHTYERAKAFKAGALQAAAPLPYLGKPINVEIEFYADSSYVTDRFPQAQLVRQTGTTSVLTIPTKDGYGIRMWLLEQAGLVKVRSPKNVRDYVIHCLKDAVALYENQRQ